MSSREYWNRYEGLDCVILFIPHDEMYHAAIQDEAELIRNASEKRVFVGDKIRSAVTAYNDAISGLDRFIVSKARTLKQLGTAKGEEPELPDAIEVEPRDFASPELQDSNESLAVTGGQES